MKTVAIVVSTSLVLMSAVSFAQSQPMTPVEATTPTADLDRSASNTADKMPAEGQKAAADHYTKLDTNQDGKLSKSEFNATPKTGQDFGTLDSDQDGSLTAMEFSKNMAQ